MAGAMFVLAGCAGTPTETGAPPEPEAAPVEPEPERDDLHFHLRAAERLGTVGEVERALEHYLDAARLSEDPAVAEQVTRLSVSLGEWQSAAAGAERWLELQPWQWDARQIAVVANLRLGRLGAAGDLLVPYIEEAEDPEDAWENATWLLAAAHDEEVSWAALEALSARMGLEAGSPGANLQASRLAWQLGEEERAIELAEQAARPDYPAGLIWAGQLAVARDDLERALGHYRNARRSDPEDEDLALAEAEILRQMNALDDALAVLEALPQNAEVLYTRGSYLISAEREEEAREVWRALSRIEAEDPSRQAYFTAVLAELVGLEAEAVDWYGRVEHRPQKYRSALRRAVLLGRQSDIEAAQAVLRELRATDGGTHREQAWLTEGQILSDAGRHAEAIEVLSTGLAELPDSVPLLYSRAMAAVSGDDLGLAEQDLRAIMQADPENAMAFNALGYTLTDRTDRHREALRLIERALELEPDNPAIQDSMGWVYFRLGRPEEALPYLRAALEGDYHPEIAAHLGEVLIALGEDDEGRQVLLEAREAFPEDEYLAETLERLGIEH